MSAGIYVIRNTENNKIYVGSALDVLSRLWHHKNDLRKGKHRNRYLQNAWNKYTEGAFVFEQILQCEPNKLLELETHYILRYKSGDREFGYNIAYPVRQDLPSPEMSKIAKMIWHDPRVGHNRRQGIKAKWEDKQFRAAKAKDFERGRAVAHLRWKDQEFRTRQSKIRSEKWNDPEWRKAREADLKIKTQKAHTSEAKAKRKSSLKAMWADPEFKAKHIDRLRRSALAMTRARIAKRAITSSNEIV